MTPLEALIQRVVEREGPPADVGDGKGLTCWGQTPEWLASFNFSSPSTPEQAAANYLEWVARVGLTPLVAQGDDLADILLDVAVMSSAPKAVKALQQVLGVAVDGQLGPVTLAALFKADRGQLARAVIAWDMTYQARLVVAQPALRLQWLVGWTNRIAEHVRRLA